MVGPILEGERTDMKKPFEKLKTKIDLIEEDRNRLRKEIADLEDSVKAMDDAKMQAASEDDIDGYTRAREAKERAAVQIEMKKIKLAGLKDVPKEDIFDAWREYRTMYEKEFDKAEAALRDAKQKYVDAIRNLAIVQNNGLKEQARFGALLGWVPGENRVGNHGGMEVFNLVNRLPLKVFKYGDILKDAMLNYRGKAKNPDVALYLTQRPETKIDIVMKALLPVKEDEI